MAATKTYESKQAAICDCGHDYAAHAKSLRGKLICVYRHPRTDEPCYCDQFTITMKKVLCIRRAAIAQMISYGGILSQLLDNLEKVNPSGLFPKRNLQAN